jgi:adenylyl- and sulfurtransferase ThiI
LGIRRLLFGNDGVSLGMKWDDSRKLGSNVQATGYACCATGRSMVGAAQLVEQETLNLLVVGSSQDQVASRAAVF